MELKFDVIDPYGFIYITTNIINGKKYIGQRRFDSNCKWKDYLGSGVHLKYAIKFYGKENFIKEIITISYNKHELDLMEIEFIKNHDAVNSEDYYNISFGGTGGDLNSGRHFPEETRKKISEATKGKNNPNYGKPWSNEFRQKFRQACSKFTPEQAVEIREKYSSGKYSQYELAEEYNVKQQLISIVVNFKGAYNDLSEEANKHIIKPQIKFNKDQVLEIREKYAKGGFKQIELAEEYLCSQSVISKIVNSNYPTII